MRFQTLTRSAALVAVVSLFSACSSDPTGPSFDGTFTEGEGTFAGNILVVTLKQALETMSLGDPLSGRVGFVATIPTAPSHLTRPSRFPLPAPGVGTRGYLSQLQASAPGCAIEGHGADGDYFDPYDGNGNDIADDFAVRIECTTVDSVGEGVTITYKDLYDLTMKERPGIDWGFDASVHLLSTQKRSDETVADEMGYDLTERLVVNDGKGVYHHVVSSWGKGLDGTEPYAYDDGGDITLTFISDGDPMVLHETLPAGSVTVTGRTYFTELGDANLEWRISTSNALTFDPGCADEADQPFTAGEVAGALSGSSSKYFTATAHACGSGWTISATGFEAP